MVKINSNVNNRLNPSSEFPDDNDSGHKPGNRPQTIHNESLLKNIYLRHGEFIHKLVLNYLDMPEINMVDIAREANISKQQVHKWLVGIHGTTKKKRLSKVCKTKKAKPWEIIPELKRFDLTQIKGSNYNLYSIPINNRKVLIRKSVWYHNSPNVKYARLNTIYHTNPDLIVLVVEGDKYVFPFLSHRKESLIISHKKLEPYKNKFEYLLKPLGEVPKIKIKTPGLKYRGVFKIDGFYYVRIYVNREFISLGRYKTDIEAARVYDKAVLYFCPRILKTNGLEKKPFDEIDLAMLIRGLKKKKRKYEDNHQK